jgi:hypothetical protein
MEMTEIKPSEVQMCERPEVTCARAAAGRYPCLTWGPKKASFWAATELESPSMFHLILESSFPYPFPNDYTPEKYPRIVPLHCVDVEIDNVGMDEFLDINPGYNSDPEWLPKWMMEEGLAPGQAFRVMAEVNYVGSTSMEWIGTEWELEVYWEIVEREYIEPAQALRRWQEYVDDFKRVADSEAVTAIGG